MTAFLIVLAVFVLLAVIEDNSHPRRTGGTRRSANRPVPKVKDR